MKIGIISINMYSKGLNFACPLHTYAFQQFLQSRGIESTIIDYKPIYYGNFDLRHPFDAYQLGYRNLLEKKRKMEADGEPLDWIITEIDRIRNLRDDYGSFYQEREIRYDKFQNFIDTNYVKTDVCYNPYLLDFKDPGFDCYICVTDVIWSPDAEKGFDWGFFLNCGVMNSKYKIAYAASRGVFQGYTDEQERDFLQMIGMVDEIAVREDALRDWINEHTDRSVDTVLDPVLLHDGEFWKKLAVEPEEKGYILLYYVKEKAKDTIRNAIRYAVEHNLDIVELSDKPSFHNTDKIKQISRYDVGPEEWLGYILHADRIFTNSFHACCFSILFEKVFYVGKRNGDKVGQILATCGLEDRRISKDIPLEEMAAEIDYVKVKARLEAKRKESETYLLQAIAHGEERMRQSHTLTKSEKYNRSLTYSLHYYSGKVAGGLKWTWNQSEGKVQRFTGGAAEFIDDRKTVNDGRDSFRLNRFSSKNAEFVGWRLRIRVGQFWCWYRKDGTLASKDEMGKAFADEVMLFRDGDKIPILPVNHMDAVVAEGVWKNTQKKAAAAEKKDQQSGANSGAAGWEQGVNSTAAGQEQSGANSTEGGHKQPEAEPAQLSEEERRLLKVELRYYSGKETEDLSVTADESQGDLTWFHSGACEYTAYEKVENTGTHGLTSGIFKREAYDFTGWKLRMKSRGSWFWYMKDETLCSRDQEDSFFEDRIMVLSDGASLPYLPADRIDVVVLEAQWVNREQKKAEETLQYPKSILPGGTATYRIHYHSGFEKGFLRWNWNKKLGYIKEFSSGTVEYIPLAPVVNNESTMFEKNHFIRIDYRFVGWRLRVKVGDLWCWYLDDGTLSMRSDYEGKIEEHMKYFKEGEPIPYLQLLEPATAVAEAIWEKELFMPAFRGRGIQKKVRKFLGIK